MVDMAFQVVGWLMGTAFFLFGVALGLALIATAVSSVVYVVLIVLGKANLPSGIGSFYD